MTVSGMIELLRRFPQDSEVHCTLQPIVRVGGGNDAWVYFNCPTENLPQELREAAERANECPP
jgi:hypothetical protein